MDVQFKNCWNIFPSQRGIVNTFSPCLCFVFLTEERNKTQPSAEAADAPPADACCVVRDTSPSLAVCARARGAGPLSARVCGAGEGRAPSGAEAAALTSPARPGLGTLGARTERRWGPPTTPPLPSAHVSLKQQSSDRQFHSLMLPASLPWHRDWAGVSFQ